MSGSPSPASGTGVVGGSLQRLLSGGTRAYYSAHAADWEELRRLYYRESIAEAVLARVPEGRLLDVGCGPGFLLVKALADPRFRRVVGVDFSNSMLTLLRARFENGHRLHLRLADARRLPFRDGSFDGVVSNMGLHHLAEPWWGLAEMARVARPGGRVVVSDLRPHGHEFFREAFADAWLGFEEAELRRWMAEAGLGNVVVEDAGSVTVEHANGSARRVEVEVFVASGERL